MVPMPPRWFPNRRSGVVSRPLLIAASCCTLCREAKVHSSLEQLGLPRLILLYLRASTGLDAESDCEHVSSRFEPV